jgi:predicted dinucleotide-utilizing enzyme
VSDQIRGLYATDQRTGLAICMICGAVVASEQMHDTWHDNISSVAIESTKRIERLEADVDRINAGSR